MKDSMCGKQDINKFAFQINTKMKILLPFRGGGREVDEPVYLPNSFKSYQVWGNDKSECITNQKFINVFPNPAGMYILQVFINGNINGNINATEKIVISK